MLVLMKYTLIIFMTVDDMQIITFEKLCTSGNFEH